MSKVQHLLSTMKKKASVSAISKKQEESLTEKAPPTMVHLDEASVSERYEDIYQEYIPDQVIKIMQQGNDFDLLCANNICLKVQVISNRVIRFRYAIKGNFGRDFSYAIDPDFTAVFTHCSTDETETTFIISTGKLKVLINKTNLKISIYNTNGNLISSDHTGFYAKWTILKGITEVKISKKTTLTEQFFGLGDKTCALDLRGERLENWNTDAFAYHDKLDPLYRTIPFYYGLNEGRAYGIFMDNTYRSFFDFAKTEDDQVNFSATGGEMNYYFIYGPDLQEVAQQYTDLTGRPELPPMWAFGFHQCRWSYFPDSRVKEVTTEFRRRQIPCDAIYLDIDYMDGYRCFTWNHTHFPAPTQLISDLKEQGFQTVVMIDPGIKEDPDYFVYQQGIEQGLFCKRTDGELMRGPVWPPECVFPDFTNPKVRTWWEGLYQELYVTNGVSGFWNDMNEPAVFKVNRKTFPDNVLHDYDGDLTDHSKAHNIYGLQMSRATYQGLKKLQPEKRPIVITRATFSGGQRFACAWTGDNVASWEHLRLANLQCQRMSISGFSHIGTDVGGFVDRPEPELFVRWLQLGVFHPLYRVHSMGNNVDGAAEANADEVIKAMKIDRMDQEPWSFGDLFTPLAKAAIELRYQLLPYLYTAFRRYTLDGTPVLQSLTFFDQQDEKTYGREQEFMFGKDVLVCPALESVEDAPTTAIYLPKGNWYYYWNNAFYTGQQEVEITSIIDEIPFFIQAGAVLPHYPIMQYTGERSVDILTLKTYYNKGYYQSELYEDAGEGYAYQNEDFSLKTYVTEGTERFFKIIQTKKGKLIDTYTTIQIEVYGLPNLVKNVQVDGIPLNYFRRENKSLVLKVQNNFERIEVGF